MQMILDTAQSIPGTRQLIATHFRCPEELLPEFRLNRPLAGAPGFFRIGEDLRCFGQSSSCTPAPEVSHGLADVAEHIEISDSSVTLPFDPAQVISNLRNERYIATMSRTARTIAGGGLVRQLYYRLRPLLSVPVRKHLQRLYLRHWNRIPFPQWPVDRTVENLFERFLILAIKSNNLQRVPFIWFWPDAAPSATIVTHDVETSKGRDFCSQLMDMNDFYGVKSSFQVVPESRYSVPDTYLANIHERGFEVAVHDLNHDGLLFADKTEFVRRSAEINRYGRQWNAKGFRSGILYRNTDWYEGLEFLYDMSIPNVAHLDPQRGGCCTVFPFFVGDLVELPLTTIQDYSLFHILKDHSISLWQEQTRLILQKHGLISFLVHPDYIISEKEQAVYRQLLAYIQAQQAAGQTWIALPREVAAWWRLRNNLTLVKSRNGWKIEGDGAERARVAYASVIDGALHYEVVRPNMDTPQPVE